MILRAPWLGLDYFYAAREKLKIIFLIYAISHQSLRKDLV